MNGASPITDAVGFGVFLAGLIYGPQVAAIVGPYIVIILAAVVGASFAVKRKEKTTRLGALFYFVRVSMLAVLLTVGLASVFSSYYDNLTERALITPVALGLGVIGDDFRGVAKWVINKFFAGLDFFRKDDKEKPQ